MQNAFLAVKAGLMDVAEFRAQILDRRLLVLFDFWQQARGVRRMPDWADLKPEFFGAALPHSWVWQIDAAGEARLRIIGESVMQMMELNLKGKTPYDLYGPEQAAQLTARLRRIMNEPSANFSAGEVYAEGQMIGIGQRLGLPYLDRKAGRLGVIGGSVMDKRLKSDPNGGTAIYSLSSEENYLPLTGT
jgi:hypothetical protein